MHSIHQNKWQLWAGFHCHRKQMKISKLAFLDWFLYMQYQLKTHPILEDGKVNTPSTFCDSFIIHDKWIMERMFYTDEYSFSLWKRQWMNNSSLSFVQCQSTWREVSCNRVLWEENIFWLFFLMFGNHFICWPIFSPRNWLHGKVFSHILWF